jgi:DnaJ family protein C protein 7
MNLFKSKKKADDPETTQKPPKATTEPTPERTEKNKKSVREPREKDRERRSNSTKASSSSSSKPSSPTKAPKPFSRSSTQRFDSRADHPLNLPPEELRRLSAMSAMSDQPTPMDIDRDLTSSPPLPPTSPANQSPQNGMPKQNGANGRDTPLHDEEVGPRPPPHRVPTSPPPATAGASAPVPAPAPAMPAKPPVDAEACKTSGNKFFKAKEYDKAVKEYSKGMFSLAHLRFSLSPKHTIA